MENNQTYEIIEQARQMLWDGGVQGVQFMKVDNNKAIFEAFGTAGDNEYVTYTVDLVEAIEREEITIERVNVTVESYEESQEIDVTINTWVYDEGMNEISFNDELVKTYKRYGYAEKKAKEIVLGLVGANLAKTFQ